MSIMLFYGHSRFLFNSIYSNQHVLAVISCNVLSVDEVELYIRLQWVVLHLKQGYVKKTAIFW